VTEIRWINHAGYEINTGGVRIAHDPWLSGLAFNGGWSLVSDTVYRSNDLAEVDFIWLSHEHPDHFSPAAFLSIPEGRRRNITVLFQQTRDQRVVKYLKSAGFTVRELPDGERTSIGRHLWVTCGQVSGRDSWLFLETPDCAVFNSNDCVGADWSTVAKRLNRPVDLLLTQFSYANWVGNPGDSQQMTAAAARKIDQMRQQIAAFRPSAVVPFASFVWFCRADNFHLNAHANRIEDVLAELGSDTNLIVLYPGDLYRLGDPHENALAVSRYSEDWAQCVEPLALHEAPTSMAELLELSEKEQRRLRAANWLWLLTPLAWLHVLRPVSIFLDDLTQGLSYSMMGGVGSTTVPLEECDLVMTSSSFALMLRTGFGYGTLSVNGRLLERTPGAMTQLGRHFAVAARNEEGITIPALLLERQYMFSHIRRAARAIHMRTVPRRSK
jgi:UDP-MurNAc hydroxylase